MTGCLILAGLKRTDGAEAIGSQMLDFVTGKLSPLLPQRWANALHASGLVGALAKKHRFLVHQQFRG